MFGVSETKIPRRSLEERQSFYYKEVGRDPGGSEKESLFKCDQV